MQRARSSHGQVAVSTQSVSDVASATGNEQLLASLTDNFTGFVLHRQTTPESRDWLAMLLGTRELWQSTDRTAGGGAMLEGSGSRRRAAEFVVRPDEFKLLRPGEAVVWSTLGPPPVQVTVTPGPVLDPGAARADAVYRPLDIAAMDDALEKPPDERPLASAPQGEQQSLDIEAAISAEAEAASPDEETAQEGGESPRHRTSAGRARRGASAGLPLAPSRSPKRRIRRYLGCAKRKSALRSANMAETHRQAPLLLRARGVVRSQPCLAACDSGRAA